MLQDDISLDELLELSPRNLAEFCDELIDARTLEAELDGFRPFGRKRLCEYLDIGESTLSGWLKESRVPRMAKEAFLLPVLMSLFQQEIRRLRTEADDIKILKNGEVLQLCLFAEGADGLVLGRVVADGIRDLNLARLLAASLKSLRMLGQARDVVDEMLERTENEGYIRHLEELRAGIESAISMSENLSLIRKKPEVEPLRTEDL